MKAASANRDTSGGNPAVGKVEAMAGRAVGCEGMEKEGSESQGRTQ